MSILRRNSSTDIFEDSTVADTRGHGHQPAPLPAPAPLVTDSLVTASVVSSEPGPAQSTVSSNLGRTSRRHRLESMSESAFFAPETNDHAVTFEEEGDFYLGITQIIDQQFPIGRHDTRLSTSNAASSSAGPRSAPPTSTTTSATSAPTSATTSPAVTTDFPADSHDSMPRVYTVSILNNFLNSHVSHVR